MTKQILILKGDRPDTSQTGSYFTWENLQRLGSDTYELGKYSDIVFTIIDGKVTCMLASSGRDLASYDLVYIRDITHENVRNSVALYLKHHNKKFINAELHNTQYTDKLLQYVALAIAGISVPQTVFASSGRRKQASAVLGDAPFVMKSTTGSNGNDNFLIQQDGDFEREGSYVIQALVPNDFDYRVIVGGDDVLLAYKRVRQTADGYLNNVSQGATRELATELDDDVRVLAVKAAQTLGRTLSGVDVLENSQTGQRHILEVNFNYGSPRFEAAVLDEYFKKLASFLNQASE